MAAHISSVDAPLHSQFESVLFIIGKVFDEVAVRVLRQRLPADREMELFLRAFDTVLLEPGRVFVFMPEVREAVMCIIMANRRNQNSKAI